MTRRPAVTLIEVLIAMFIMAIGMLALLVLFPLGAVSMGHALQDDRCASTAAMAENVAIAMNIRRDGNVSQALASSQVVYVDPYGRIHGFNVVGTSNIPRVAPSFVTSIPLADRWFSLPDDITFFSTTGVPDTITTGNVIDRGRRYSYAYLLHQPPGASNLVQLYVVVYAARPVNTLTLETTLGASGSAGTNSIVINAVGTTIKRGGWVLDSGNGLFYRVTNLQEVYSTSPPSTILEVQSNLIANVGQVTIMDDVAEVFDKGTGWLP